MVPSRRTHPSILAEVIREVDLMLEERVKGPVSLLVSRLAARGVSVGEATLRAGDCREHLEKIWSRRKGSIRSFGPTGGHDLRPVEELVDHVLDLRAMIARVKADLEGVAATPPQFERDARSVAICTQNDAKVAALAALIPEVIEALARDGIWPTFKTVAARLTADGHSITHRSIRRNEAYWRPILTFQQRSPPIKPSHPDRTSLRRKSAEELGAMVYRLTEEHRTLCARFEATLN